MFDQRLVFTNRNLGTSVINSPMYPSFLINWSLILAAAQPPPAAATPKKDYTETRIQIRQTNGQPIVQENFIFDHLFIIFSNSTRFLVMLSKCTYMLYRLSIKIPKAKFTSFIGEHALY